MAHDPELADRIRELLAAEAGLSERRMFGGVAFLLDGNMALAASGQDGLMIRVGPEQRDKLLGPGVAPMEMRGRPLKGWLLVDLDAVRTARQLAHWVRIAVAFTRTLPPKQHP